MALITAAQFREHFPQVTGTGEDTLIGTLITRADSLMAAACGWPVPDGGARTMEDVTYTRYVLGPLSWDSRGLDLGIRPVQSITSAYVSIDWTYGASDLVDSGDYVLDSEAGILWLKPSASSSWAENDPRANKITIVAGFTTTPPDLVALCAATVRHLLDLRRSQGSQSMSAGGQSLTREDAVQVLPQAVLDGLGPYTLWGYRAG